MGLRIVLLCLFFWIMSDSVQSQLWAHHRVLDDDDRFHLHWKPPKDKRGDSEITFKVEVETTGYFGLGFSPNGGMPGSDIVTGWIKDGEIYFQDRYATDFNLPHKDDQENYELIHAFENDTFTVFEFRRRLNTCDENDMVIDDSTMRVIYAYSEEDPEFDDPFYHRGNRGWKNVLFLLKEIKEHPDLNYTSLLTWDVMSPGIDFSSHDILYWCKIFQSPLVSEKNHIVYVKPVFEDDHEQFVHHMALHECVGGSAEVYDVFVGQKGHACTQPNDTPNEMLKCDGHILNWAIGGEDVVFPEHVGLPIYPGTGRYYRFEIHYHNPQLVSGMIDHSGFRFYYTPKIREFDTGNTMFGGPVLPRLFIPPGQEEYVVVGHTSPQCVPWAEKGIKAIAVSLHAHLSTRKFKVRHFRGNRELSPLVDDKSYNFSYQDYRFFMEEIHILPGDQITVECTYNSSGRSNVTLGGPDVKDEMCMAFVLYYPQVDRHVSFSTSSFATISDVFGTNITSETDVTSVLENYDWATIDIDTVQNAMRYSEHDSSCHLDFSKTEMSPLVSYPDDIIPYEQESTCNITM